ncbi:hypothetical protein ABIE05_004127, partial [Kosakonia cowanii]
MASKGSKNWLFNAVLSKKETVENFFEIRGCQGKLTPYNAPPLTRHNGKHTGLSG